MSDLVGNHIVGFPARRLIDPSFWLGLSHLPVKKRATSIQMLKTKFITDLNKITLTSVLINDTVKKVRPMHKY